MVPYDYNVVDPTGGGTLEMALLADGVQLDELYPLDIDRALRSLERLGRANIIWHNTNAEPIQQLTSGAVPLASCFNGRVVAANRSGGQIGYTSAYSGVMGNPYGVGGQPSRRSARVQSRLQRRERQSLLRDREFRQQEGGV